MAADDEHPLTAVDRPAFESGEHTLRLADLFCGCGGLTLGVAQAARTFDVGLDVALAVDFDKVATKTYSLNFPKATVRKTKIQTLFKATLGAELNEGEQQIREDVGEIQALVGGPPCQGHSDLNNHTRRDDPKNAFYKRMARAAEVLNPTVVMVENVPTVRHDKGGVVDIVTDHLQHLGYAVADAVIKLEDLGVAQRRRRHILLAVRDDVAVPEVVLKSAVTGHDGPYDVKWAIGDLEDRDPDGILDTPPKASVDNLARMEWLLKNNKYNLPNELRPRCHRDKTHSYNAMYGRLKWTDPAQTITSGYGSIGQGRYMHPSLTRALTPHEAARLQGFPDYFKFHDAAKRAELATMIGNAVPPALSAAVFSVLMPSLVDLD
ncbi:MAG: DNA cytosine methyltransferase [Frankiaceae bacterium]|nr:DNA cytosine methyltransferase [Frankiaceae bacterium]